MARALEDLSRAAELYRGAPYGTMGVLPGETHAVAQAMIDARQRLGYVPEANEASMLLAFGAVNKASRNYSQALGATLPTEAEVRDWAEHQAAVGTTTKALVLDPTGVREVDVPVEPIAAYPNLERARRNQDAIDAYRAEHGGGA